MLNVCILDGNLKQTQTRTLLLRGCLQFDAGQHERYQNLSLICFLFQSFFSNFKDRFLLLIYRLIERGLTRLKENKGKLTVLDHKTNLIVTERVMLYLVDTIYKLVSQLNFEAKGL